MKINKTFARILLSILIIVILATIVVAIFFTPEYNGLLWALLFCDIVIPVIIYAYIVVTKQIRKINGKDSQKDN